MIFLLCGFGAFFATQMVKVLSPVLLRPGLKVVLALVGSAGISGAVFYRQPADLVIYAVGGAGLAVTVHRAARLIRVMGDWYLREILKGRKHQ